MTGSSFRDVSSIEVKSTCSNSPGPLQVKAAWAQFGGAASNLRQWPHFLMRLRRSGPFLATRIAPASERRSDVGLGVRLAVATVHCRTAVPLRHHKLKDGLLAGPIWVLRYRRAFLRSNCSLALT